MGKRRRRRRKKKKKKKRATFPLVAPRVCRQRFAAVDPRFPAAAAPHRVSPVRPIPRREPTSLLCYPHKNVGVFSARRGVSLRGGGICQSKHSCKCYGNALCAALSPKVNTPLVCSVLSRAGRAHLSQMLFLPGVVVSVELARCSNSTSGAKGGNIRRRRSCDPPRGETWLTLTARLLTFKSCDLHEAFKSLCKRVRARSLPPGAGTRKDGANARKEKKKDILCLICYF